VRVTVVLSVVILLAAGAADTASDKSSRSDDPVIIGHRYTLVSEILGEARSLFVRVPEHYGESDARYPVLYVLDAGESRFHDVTAAARTLADQGRIPPLVVVAVPTPSRNRDLTPAVANPDSDVPASAGGADRFLSFLTAELIPYIDGNFRTTPHRTVVGVSFGGLFAFHALSQATCTFDAYVAVSPSLWWDDRELIQSLEEAVLRPCAASDRLVFTIADEGARMRDPLEETAELLERVAPGSFDWQVLEIPGETHETTASRATYAGLRAVFGDWEIGDQAVTGAESLKRLYRQRADRYGVNPKVPAGSYFQVGWRLLAEGEVEQAREMFVGALEVDPDHTLAVAGLGMAQERLGDTEEARRNLLRAVELAERESHPMLPQIRDALAGVEAGSREQQEPNE
jgi:predicted alpha/beta superfamily hydrolase